MIQARPCDQCGQPYVAKRPNSRYCSDLCRQRSKRGFPKSTGSSPAGSSAASEPQLVVSVLSELEKADRVDSALGQQALMLARRITTVSDTGSSVAALSKELRATLADALSGVEGGGDDVDELRERRDAKRDRAAAG